MYTHISLPLSLPPSLLYPRQARVWSGLDWTEEIVLLKISKRSDVMQWLGCLKWATEAQEQIYIQRNLQYWISLSQSFRLSRNTRIGTSREIPKTNFGKACM